MALNPDFYADLQPLDRLQAEAASQSPPRVAMPPTDFFVVQNADGLYWSGSDWVGDPMAAQQFAAPPLADPWLACRRASAELAARFGTWCVPVFFFRPQGRLLGVPGGG